MLKKFLFAAVIAIAGAPAVSSAQDFFFSFEENARVNSLEVAESTASTGTLYLFADENISFNQADIDFAASNSAFAGFNGAGAGGADAGLNSDLKFSTVVLRGPTVPDPADPTMQIRLDDPTADEGNLAIVSLFSPPIFNAGGIVAGNTADPDFRAGANGFLLAEVEFDVLGGAAGSSSEFSLSLGTLGVAQSDSSVVTPDFAGGSATVSVAAANPGPAIPEPSSAVLLLLGVAGMAARRTRS